MMQDFIAYLFSWLAELGYIGILLGLMVEVIPSEIVLSYGGYLVSQGHITFSGALLAGVIGGTVAQMFLYWLGMYGGRPFLNQFGKYILIYPKHIDASEQWFKRYGPGVLFTARFVPVIRHAISIPAGVSKMPVSQFLLYTIAAMIPWSFLFLLAGMQLGDNWKEIKTYAKPFLIPIIGLAIISMIVYFVWKGKKSIH